MRLAALIASASLAGCLPAGRSRGVTETTYVIVGAAIVVGFLVGAALDLQPDVDTPPRPMRPVPNP